MIRGQSIVVPAFVFRIELEDARSYRSALGEEGDTPPSCMALRALADSRVIAALRDLSADATPVHAGQSIDIETPLCANVDYSCQVRLSVAAERRLRIEQVLHAPDGSLCLSLSSDIVLVGG